MNNCEVKDLIEKYRQRIYNADMVAIDQLWGKFTELLGNYITLIIFLFLQDNYQLNLGISGLEKKSSLIKREDCHLQISKREKITSVLTTNLWIICSLKCYDRTIRRCLTLDDTCIFTFQAVMPREWLSRLRFLFLIPTWEWSQWVCIQNMNKAICVRNIGKCLQCICRDANFQLDQFQED